MTTVWVVVVERNGEKRVSGTWTEYGFREIFEYLGDAVKHQISVENYYRGSTVKVEVRSVEL